MIKFKCPNCNHRIGAPDDYAGKKARCSKCKHPVRIPTPHNPEQQHIGDDMLDLSALAAGQAVEAVETEKTNPQQDHQKQPIDPRYKSSMLTPKPIPVRKLPWPIDIMLYPATITATFSILIVVFGRIITAYGGGYRIMADLMLSAYIYWYCCECIRDSSDGNLRAPNAFTGGFDIMEEFHQYLKVVATCTVFLGPIIIYSVYCWFNSIEPEKTILISLAAYGLTFFPMGILAMVLFDSLHALNPWLLIRSILSTLPQYVGLTVVFYGITAAYYFLVTMVTVGIAEKAMVSDAQPSLWYALGGIFIFKVVSETAFLWISMVLAHLLGRFYFKYEEKLYWEV